MPPARSRASSSPEPTLTHWISSDLRAILLGALDRTAPAYSVIKKVLANGSAVLRQTRNPLVLVPPVNLLRLLLSQGIPKTEACGLTARFLTRWEPDRFRGLQADHVRRRYERLGGSRRPG